MIALGKFLLAGGVLAAAGTCALMRGESPEPMALDSELPGLVLPNHEGESVDLAQRKGDEYLLIYFYPKADTPGCTAQACSLRDAFAQLQDQGVRVFGVSTDSVRAQKAFREKHQLPFELLSDRQGELAAAFGVPLRFRKFPSRQAFLFKKGRLVWRDLKASTSQQASDVLAVVNRGA